MTGQSLPEHLNSQSASSMHEGYNAQARVGSLANLIANSRPDVQLCCRTLTVCVAALYTAVCCLCSQHVWVDYVLFACSGIAPPICGQPKSREVMHTFLSPHLKRTPWVNPAGLVLPDTAEPAVSAPGKGGEHPWRHVLCGPEVPDHFFSLTGRNTICCLQN